MNYSFYKESADYVSRVLNRETDIGVILGSVSVGLLDKLEDKKEINYADIPNFLTSSAPGHAGKLVSGFLDGVNVLCMSGSFHSYEGYTFEQLSMPVRLFKCLGAKALILTNAAGAVNLTYKPGDVMIITDQIVFSGTSPLRGENVSEFGSRFFDVSNMYSKELIKTAEDCSQRSSLTVHEGIYFWMPGPQFETPAEIRAIRILGGDAVGMSTVTEALTAAHCGLPVLGLSVMTNMAAGILDVPLTAEEVTETAERTGEGFSSYLAEIIKNINLS